jgi:predicted DNA-binding antitoxin AbrB/MazE fold protein
MATYDGGVFYPDQPLALAPQQRVALIVQIPEPVDAWLEDVAQIYQELAEEDRQLAAAMFPTVRDTWPPVEERT